ncbi:MAG: glycine cleavage system aminomethyltransferase GcvT [Planctomycetes bacterium]|nr:glycine cleavage system aminomethyltransferase GcvT [Planctomycetota bacterium]
MNAELAQTPLHSWHVRNGGRMVDFAGWSMPVQYSSLVEEHHATRRAAGLFDVSHMGRFRIAGEGTAAFLDRLVTRRVADLEVGQIRYALVCNEKGGVLDDVLVYRLAEEGGEPFFWMVVNAGNRAKIANWIKARLAKQSPAKVSFRDETAETAMIAVQGPAALVIAAPVCDANPAELDYYTGAVTQALGQWAIVSRTGYTGEDGCEIIVPAEAGLEVWEKVLQQAKTIDVPEPGVKPAGLGARDTLRLEAAMPLYGHELTEGINPLQAGLKFAVNLKDREFVGRDAIAGFQDDAAMLVRVGLELSGRRAARQGYTIFAEDRQVGEVTSGAFSPTLERPIAMGYVAREASRVGTPLEVDIRGRRESAQVGKLPFYRRKT